MVTPPLLRPSLTLPTMKGRVVKPNRLVILPSCLLLTQGVTVLPAEGDSLDVHQPPDKRWQSTESAGNLRPLKGGWLMLCAA